MIAIVKKPKIEIRGDIPEEFLVQVKSYFGAKAVTVRRNDDEETVDITTTAWYKKMKKKATPGTTLKVYRELRNMTQKELADKLDIARTNLSAMEHDKRPISKPMAVKLAKLFSVGVERFITIEP
jgi:DNA-binding XRE family transcriptional regulator